MSKKAARSSMLPPLILVLVVLTVAMFLTGQASLPVFGIIVAAVLAGTIAGAMTAAWYERRKTGSR